MNRRVRVEDDEDIRKIEEWLKRREEQHRQRIDEEEQRRQQAIEFLKQHTFILGSCNGEGSETETILKYTHRIRRLQQHYGIEFRVFVWSGKVIAIPANTEPKAAFRININELLPHAKRFGETLAFFVECDAK